MTLKPVVAICIEMYLPPLVSLNITESAVVRFNYANKQHMLYHHILTVCYCNSIDECNTFLHGQGFKSLIGDE